MNDSDRINEARELRRQLGEIHADAGWREIQEHLVTEHARLTDELVELAPEWTEARIRDRLGELRAYSRIATTPMRIARRLEHLERALTEKAERARAEAERQPDEDDALEAAIAAARLRVAQQAAGEG